MWMTSSLVTELILTCLDNSNATLVELRTCHVNQCVLHVVASLVCGARKYDHMTFPLQEFHWQSIRDRITLKLATLVLRCMHGLAPVYLAQNLNCSADVNSRRRLRSGSTAPLLVSMTRCRTLGDYGFLVAAAQVWNSLPTTLISQSSMLTVRQQLKTFLFEHSYL